jgi:hypothetical protein
MTEDGAVLLRAAVLDSTGAADAVETAPRAAAPAIAMTTARFIICLFMSHILSFLRAVSQAGKSLVRHH